jgi:hypothetical protein
MRGFVVVLFIVFGLFVRWNIWGFLLGVRTDIGWGASCSRPISGAGSSAGFFCLGAESSAGFSLGAESSAGLCWAQDGVSLGFCLFPGDFLWCCVP